MPLHADISPYIKLGGRLARAKPFKPAHEASDAHMIRYTLKCANTHSFDSWFKSADGFDVLTAAGQVSCPMCGSSEISKALMTPLVSTARPTGSEHTEQVNAPSTSDPQSVATDVVPNTTSDQRPSPLSAPSTDTERAIAAMRDHVERNSDYVGLEFSKQARAMHDGDAPTRAIYGEAKLEDAKALLEDGIAVIPLPFTPKRSTN